MADEQFFAQRKQDFLSNSPIAPLLPVKFTHGFSVKAFAFQCASCNDTLPDNDVRGVVTRWGGNRVNLVGDGLCRKCQTLIRFDVRVSQPEPDGEVETIFRCPRTHEWRRMVSEPERKLTLLDRLRIFIEDIFNPPG